MSESVTREVVLPLERDEAWRVVTEPDHLREWLADDVEIDLVEGGLIELGWDGGGRRHGIVETVEEHERLVFRWRPDEPGPVHIETTVEIGLDDVAEGTRVTVVETGLRGARGRQRRRAAPPSAAGPGTCAWARAATCR